MRLSLDVLLTSNLVVGKITKLQSFKEPRKFDKKLVNAEYQGKQTIQSWKECANRAEDHDKNTKNIFNPKSLSLT